MAGGRVIQEARPYPLDDVFKEHYAVPEFQRPYVWKKRQVEQLFYDLFEAHQERGRGEYFIGSIVTYRDSDRRNYLVDGQQRMLTLISLFAAAKDRLVALDHTHDVAFFDSLLRGERRTSRGRVREEDRVLARVNPDQEILAQLIRGRGPLLDSWQFPAFQRGLLYAYRCLSSLLEEEFGRETKSYRQFAKYILENVYLVKVQTDSFASALQIFETINARGIGLSPFDMVKNYLFVVVRPAGERRRLEKLWGTVQQRLEDTIVSGPGSEASTSVRFLRYFVMAQYQTRRVIQSRNAYPWIKDNILTKQAGLKGAMKFAQAMERSSIAFRNLHRGMYPGKTKNQSLIGAINDMGTGVRQHYPLLMAAQRHPDGVLDVLTEALERLIVIFLLAGVSWNELERKIPEWSARIRATSTVQGMKGFVSQHVQALADQHAQLAREDIRMLGLQGYAIQRYVLGRMTEVMEGKAGHPRGLRFYRDREVDITIEHILPQNTESDAAFPFDHAERLEDYIYQLGNLTLLYGIDNSYNRDSVFEDKRETFRENGQFYLTRFLGGRGGARGPKRIHDLYRRWPAPNAWNPEAVEWRTERMLRLSDEIWNLRT